MATIYVLAGTNGAGKSSIAGAMFRAEGMPYFNPDELARALLAKYSDLTPREANGLAWQQGKAQLDRAIEERSSYAFETTLGGASIPDALKRAIDAGIEVKIWYAALASPELHVQRVRARVAKGGHDIPETDIRRRYDASRSNLIELMPGLAELSVYDNSADADPEVAIAEPRLVLYMSQRRIVEHCEIGTAPAWVKPILMAAFKLDPPRRRR